MKFIPSLLIVPLLALSVACTKEAAPTAANNNNGSNNGGFTPPTGNSFKVDDTEHTPSMDAVSCNLKGNHTGVSKPFPTFTRGRLNITFHDTVNVRDLIKEGESVAFSVDTLFSAPHTAMINLDVETSEFYYLKATGKIYITRQNNKLRFTSDGTLTAQGPKWTGSGFSAEKYTRSLYFSFEEGAQF